MTRARWISLWVVVAVAGALFFFALMGMFGRRQIAGVDPVSGVAFELPKDDDEEAGRGHLLSLRLTPGRHGVAGARVLYRRGGEERYASLVLDPLGPSGLYVGEIPPQEIASRVFFYFVVETDGPSVEGSRRTPFFTIPAGAPDEARPFHLRFEGRTPAALMALHVGFSAAAPVILAHAVFFLLVVLFGRSSRKGEERSFLRAAYVSTLAAFLVFFIGTIPLGILANEAKYGASFEGWPFGGDVTDTKTEVVLLVWIVFFVWRRDLWARRGDPRPGADRALPFVFFACLFVSIAAFLIPHSYFFAG